MSSPPSFTACRRRSSSSSLSSSSSSPRGRRRRRSRSPRRSNPSSVASRGRETISRRRRRPRQPLQGPVRPKPRSHLLAVAAVLNRLQQGRRRARSLYRNVLHLVHVFHDLIETDDCDLSAPPPASVRLPSAPSCRPQTRRVFTISSVSET